MNSCCRTVELCYYSRVGEHKMKLSTAIKAKMYNRGIANLNVQGIKTTADLDTWIAKRPCRDKNGPFLMSRYQALSMLTNCAVADEILNNLSVL